MPTIPLGRQSLRLRRLGTKTTGRRRMQPGWSATRRRKPRKPRGTKNRENRRKPTLISGWKQISAERKRISSAPHSPITIPVGMGADGGHGEEDGEVVGTPLIQRDEN